jgi:starch phosphorylase
VSGDKYLVINDFPSFVDAQNRVDQTYADKAKWCKLSIQVPCRGGWGKLLQKGGHGETLWKMG